MYQVLYRKWRPKTFSDVVGQDEITTTLKNELITNRIAHAYLFTGSRGTGKTTCAKILAKAINCLNSSDGNPCLSCNNCIGIDNGSITDIIEIDAASNNGVENIRNLREESIFTPTTAKYRVYIIDEVHMLSIGAFNALLKTLEEPCEHVVFILATTEVHKIPATILSRCQRFDFNRIPLNSIAQRLLFISENENVSLDPNAAMLIAKLSDGALRDALSILDQCIIKASYYDKNTPLITMEIVSSVVGLVGKEYILSITESIINSNAQFVLSSIDDLYSNSKNMHKLCEEILESFRDLMIFKTVDDPKKITSLFQDENNLIFSQAEKISLKRVMHIMGLLQDCLQKMQHSLNTRTDIELCLIRACELDINSDNSTLLDRISKLEANFSANQYLESKSEIAKQVQQSDKVKQSETEKTISSSTVDMQKLREAAVLMNDWTKVLDQLKLHSVALFSAFTNSTAYLSGDFVLIGTQNDFAFTLLRESAKRDEMRSAIQQVTGKRYKLGPFIDTNSPKIKNDPLEEFENLIKKSGIELNKS